MSNYIQSLILLKYLILKMVKLYKGKKTSERKEKIRSYIIELVI